MYNSEFGISGRQDWKFQDSESRNSEFRKLDFRIGKLEFWKSETGPGNFRIQKVQNSELDAIRYAIVFHWFWSVGLSPKTPRPIEDITVASAFLYSLSTALSQSAVAYVHVASGRPISDRLSPRHHCSASDKRSFFLLPRCKRSTVRYTVTWPCVNIS